MRKHPLPIFYLPVILMAWVGIGFVISEYTNNFVRNPWLGLALSIIALVFIVSGLALAIYMLVKLTAKEEK